jgi:hypothetical protein
MLNPLRRTGVGQGAKLSAWNSQRNAGKAAKAESRQGSKPTSQRSRQHPEEIGRGIKAESRSGVTSQPPKVAVKTQQTSGKAQRLTAGVRQQANLPKQGRWWIPELISGTQGSIQN